MIEGSSREEVQAAFDALKDYIPFWSNVYIWKDEPKVNFSNGSKLIIPDEAKNGGSLDTYEGYIVKVGKDCKYVKEGWKVNVNRFATSTIQRGGYLYNVVTESNIVGKVETGVFDIKGA